MHLAKVVKPVRAPQPHEVVQVMVAGRASGWWMCARPSCAWQGPSEDAFRHASTNQWNETRGEPTDG